MTDLVEFLRARLDEDEAWGRSPECPLQEDPGRVLREVEAKRRIVAGYEIARDGTQRLNSGRAHGAHVMAAEAVERTLYSVLWKLAEVFSDHPDYQEEWHV